MEDSPQKKTLTLEPSDSSYPFPPYRRRLLRSRTLDTLVQLLSVCCTGDLQCHRQGDNACVEPTQVSEKQSSDGSDVRSVTKENGTVNDDKTNSIDALGRNSDPKEKQDDALVQDAAVGKSKENLVCQENGGSDGKLRRGDNSGQPNSVINDEQGAAQENNISIADFMVDDENTSDCAIQIVKEQKVVNGVVNCQTNDYGSTGQLELDKELSFAEFCNNLDSSFDMDVMIESSKVGENQKEDSSSLVDNMLQLKEMELEKLISNPSAVDSYCCLAGDKEMEEGEISGEAGVADELLSAISEDVTSLRDKTAEVVQAFDDIVGFTCNEDMRGDRRHDRSSPSVIYMANRDDDSKMEELRETATTRTEDGPSPKDVRGSLPRSVDPQGHAVEDQLPLAITDDDIGKKKRKKGPLTKERRAKKKCKEKLKRAEKNRKLGIKRLKLPPVLKEKTIKYCRHYLQGRCYEGENCNFSHDTIPLTKSKPCSHFARQSCMKGDDCPYDHELSKYPCNNYASQGFCSRGSDCLFSHEIPAKSLSTAPSVSKPELKSGQRRMAEDGGSSMISKGSQPPLKLSSPGNNSISSKKVDGYAISHQKMHGKCSFGADIPSGKVEQQPGPIRTARQTPKGVSFLSPGMPLGETSKQKQGGLSPEECGVLDVNRAVLRWPVSIDKPSEMSAVEAPRKPRGINFLTFAPNSSLDDSSCKTFSSLFSNNSSEKRKNAVGDLSEGKQSHLASGIGEIVKVNKHTSQNATDFLQNPNDGVNKNPFMTVSLPANSLSFGNNQLKDSVDANITSLLKTPVLSNTPTNVQKAVQSTLAFAAKLEPNIKLGFPKSVGM